MGARRLALRQYHGCDMPGATRSRSGLPSSTSTKSLLDALDSPEQLQELFAGFKAVREVDTSREDSNGNGDARSTLEGLEAKLFLSAQLGLALLEKQQQLGAENTALTNKQRESDATLSQLLDRLASSYRENAQLIKVICCHPVHRVASG